MKKIVLIEDDADLFALVKYNLEKEGFAVAGSQTGRGAIELCRRERPDLIILDIMLPDSDGLDICKGLRNHSELGNVPIIFLTARVSETDRILGLELGANDYIVKPFFIRELIARIKNQFRTQALPVRTIRAGVLELDRASCRVLLRGSEIALTATSPAQVMKTVFGSTRPPRERPKTVPSSVNAPRIPDAMPHDARATASGSSA